MVMMMKRKITIIYVNCVMTARGVHNSRAILLMMMMSGADSSRGTVTEHRVIGSSRLSLVLRLSSFARIVALKNTI